MLFANMLRRNALAGVAAVALLGCAAQEAGADQATAPVSSAQVLRPGTVVNVGNGSYVMPFLPATETSYALTGKEAPRAWQPAQGIWVGGINGAAFVAPTR